MASNHVRAAAALPRALGRVGVRGGRAPLARMDGAAELVCGHPHHPHCSRGRDPCQLGAASPKLDHAHPHGKGTNSFPKSA